MMCTYEGQPHQAFSGAAAKRSTVPKRPLFSISALETSHSIGDSLTNSVANCYLSSRVGLYSILKKTSLERLLFITCSLVKFVTCGTNGQWPFLRLSVSVSTFSFFLGGFSCLTHCEIANPLMQEHIFWHSLKLDVQHCCHWNIEQAEPSLNIA